jgi:hypothetical protein
VQRSSESIGTIAAALAKAQAQPPFGRMDDAALNTHFAMRRCRAGSILCARP